MLSLCFYLPKQFCAVPAKRQKPNNNLSKKMNTKSKKDITVIKGAKGWMGSDSGGQSSFKVKGGSVTIKPGQTKTIRLVTSESGFDPGVGLS